MNLATNLAATTDAFGERVALRLGETALSYNALERASARFAALLHERGIEPGDRVGMMLPNVVEFVSVYYGILRAGAVAVPMNPLLKPREVAYYLQDSAASLIVAWHALAEAVEEGADSVSVGSLFVVPGEFQRLLAGVDPATAIVARDRHDTAVIFYTSGTTGSPKGAELTHDNLAGNCRAIAELYPLREHDVTLGALPLFHAFGQTASLNATVLAGGCLTLLSRFDPELALQTMQLDGVTVFQGVPTMYSALLHHPGRGAFEITTLRICASGGAPMAAELMRSFDEAFDCTIIEGYGLSETSPVASTNVPDRERKPGSIGLPIDGVAMKIVDDRDRDVPQGEVGEIVIRGPNIMKGYWNRPEATAEAIRDGWFHSGDLGRVDEDGYFFIVDRGHVAAYGTPTGSSRA